MLSQFVLIFSNKKNIITASILSIFLFVLLRAFPQFNILRDFFSLSGISATRRLEVFLDQTFGSFHYLSFVEMSIAILFPLLISFNIIILVFYFKRQKKLLSRHGTALSLSGIFFGFFGVGCLSCGALFLAPLLSGLGLGFLLGLSTELSELGLILVLVSCLYLLRELSKPLVCE